jgi:ECF sigma factor
MVLHSLIPTRVSGKPVIEAGQVLAALATVATQLLLDWNPGNEQARDQMLPLVHSKLRRLARAFLAREGFDHTLQATALVHEAYLRLIDQRQVDYWTNRAQFVGVAAVMMRRILVNHAAVVLERDTVLANHNGCHQPMAAVVLQPLPHVWIGLAALFEVEHWNQGKEVAMVRGPRPQVLKPHAGDERDSRVGFRLR